MINIKSAQEFLDKVSPEIREHWEKTNSVNFSEIITSASDIDRKIGKYKVSRKILLVLSSISLFFYLYVCVTINRNSDPNSAVIAVLGGIALVSILFVIHTETEYRMLDLLRNQERQDPAIKKFQDTILEVCHQNTLPSKIVSAEYLKGVLNEKIKDLLLKEAILESKRFDRNVGVSEVAQAALIADNAREYFYKHCAIVTDLLGVPLNREQMFSEASSELARTHTSLSKHIKVE